MTSKQKTILLSSIGTLVLLFVVGYFAILPQMQATSYMSAAKTKHAALRTEVNKLKDLLKLDLFTKTDQTAAEMRVDIKNATKVVDSIKGKLASEKEGLTDFHEYPLLAWHPTYKDALDQQKNEKNYIDSINRAVKEMDAVLAYQDSTADIATKLEAGTKALDSTALMTSLDEMTVAFEEANTSIKEGITGMEKLTPPESLKEWHDALLVMNNELATLLDQFIASLKARDVAQMNELADKLDKLSKEGDKKSKQLAKDIVEKSVLRKYINQATGTVSEGTETI